ncbi:MULTISPECIES: PLP-dependent aminotransferase family protein [unclassified Pseudoxanthomonas]|uniref:MocR-like transcription factor YczR n=1 Tax=unclassified Pseudoxanthomonas TaxID=2645906 RepID=UPI0008E58CA1|nr:MULTISPECIES: PLP-dependent aminotransferase family protein [unclassified Pseudoxanthomonas]PPJ41002.1 PLP-dependent aminotransferase family protein [Pseudoxanthomonas sp. KAs_5_3]SFV31534.1 transcriptional regulator, GntR family [Pseudoxanthomonas sp. YR558]
MNRSMAPDRLATLVGDFPRSPAYRGLRQALQELIGDGRIPLGTRLPSERAVTDVLGVSRNTVTRAYADLVAAGFATARQGAGTFATVPIDRRRAHDHALHAVGTATSSTDGTIDLNCAAGAATPGVAAAYARALEALPAYLASDGYLPSGLPALRTRIAASYAVRGLPTAPEQIVVTSGALSAIAIIARALSRPGDRVMIESPVYSNAIEALRMGGARLVSSPMGDPLGEEGWDLASIEATLRQTSPRAAYLIPDFQNPTGFLMSDAQRVRYAAALRATRTIAIVDETLQSTRLSDAPMPAPFAAHAPDAFTIGSASKLCWGGLRVGWIRAPREHAERLIATRVQMDLGSSLFDQLVVTEMLDADGVLAARRDQLRQRRDAVVQALREHVPDWRFRLPEGGLTLWVRMPHGSATALAADVERKGVYLAPGPVFSVEGGSDQWLRIPYAKPEDTLVQAVRVMADAWNANPREGRQHRDGAKRLIA